MADDYQALAGELGMDVGGEAPAAPDNTPDQNTPANVDPDATPQTPDNPSSDPDNSVKDPDANDNTPATPPSDDAAAKAFAQLRAENSKMSKVFKQLQESMGLENPDEVIERLTQVSLQAQAKKRGLDPETLRELNEIKEQNLELMARERNKAVVESFGLVQQKFNLTNEEVMEFARTLDDKGVDLFSSNLDVTTLYRGMYHDKILAKAVEAAKQEVIKAGTDASKSAAGVNHIAGKAGDGDKKSITTMGELESLFNSMQKPK